MDSNPLTPLQWTFGESKPYSGPLLNDEILNPRSEGRPYQFEPSRTNWHDTIDKLQERDTP